MSVCIHILSFAAAVAVLWATLLYRMVAVPFLALCGRPPPPVDDFITAIERLHAAARALRAHRHARLAGLCGWFCAAWRRDRMADWPGLGSQRPRREPFYAFVVDTLTLQVEGFAWAVMGPVDGLVYGQRYVSQRFRDAEIGLEAAAAAPGRGRGSLALSRIYFAALGVAVAVRELLATENDGGFLTRLRIYLATLIAVVGAHELLKAETGLAASVAPLNWSGHTLCMVYLTTLMAALAAHELLGSRPQ